MRSPKPTARRIFKFFKTASFAANTAFVVSSAALAIKVIVLDEIPEGFEHGYEFGLVTERLLGSIIASYIFYLLVVHLREWRGKERLRPYIEKHARSVYGSCEGQLSHFVNSAGQKLTLDVVSREEIQDAFKAIAPHSNAPMVIGQAGTPANWMQWFEYWINRSRVSIERVLGQHRFLDPELIAILTAIDESGHFSFVLEMRGYQFNNPDMSVWADPFFEYCEKCRALKAYLDHAF
ncbi:MAG TPA: hypothetical protein VF704_08180 [Allosphingosinicella sp.]|jgi:hypothetical protein